jgi:DNA modification methylase
VTTPHYADDDITVWHGDSLDVLRTLPDNSVDSVVTDPPYGLEFMGKEWDRFGRDTANGYTETPRITERPGAVSAFAGASGRGVNSFQAGSPFQQWCEAWARECLRVLKPGGHLLAFGGTRTYHRLTCGIEDAGFEIRDGLVWLYASGFPKSRNVYDAIRAEAMPATRELAHAEGLDGWAAMALARPDHFTGVMDNTGDGWGTALKPAQEPIVMARKPLTGTVAATVLAWGTGAINVDGCRVQAKGRPLLESRSDAAVSTFGDGLNGSRAVGSTDTGRWPTNVLLSHAEDCGPDDTTPCVGGCPVTELDRQSGTGQSRVGKPRGAANGDGWGMTATGAEYADKGGASRFYPTFRFQAKAPTRERPSYERDGEGESRVIPGASGKVRECRQCGNRTIRSGETQPACGHDDFDFVPTKGRGDRVAHPTVKPLALMQWLVRLVTPPGGTVLEPFAGTGATGEACIIEGLRCILIERDPDYLPLITARLTKPLQPDLFGGGPA